MGRHTTRERRRGIAPWVVITAVVVILFVAATTVYLISANRRSTVADCTSLTELQVTASPGAANAMTAAALAFDATKPVARSSCISTSVTAKDGAATAAALLAGWRGASTPPPAVWVADAAADIETVDVGNAAMTSGRSATPLATSPVVLAVRPVDRASASTLTWKTLPDAVGRAGGLILGNGNRFAMTWPDVSTNRAGAQALLSVVAAVSGQRAMTVSGVAGAQPALDRLASARIRGPASTDQALAALGSGEPTYSAVPVTESELADYNAGVGSATLTAIYPAGVTAGDEILPVPITAPWITDTTSAAAASFAAYLNSEPGRQLLADHGLRVPGVTAKKPLAGVEPATAVSALPGASVAVRRALVEAFGTATGSGSGTSSGGGTGTGSGGGGSGGGTGSGGGGTSSSSKGGSGTGTGAGTVTSSGPPSATSPSPATGGAPTGRSTSRSPSLISTTLPSGSSTAPTSVLAGQSPAPATGPAVTLLVDSSASMSALDSGKSRNIWLQDALKAVVTGNPTASIGRWTVSTADGDQGYRQQVTTGPLTAAVNGISRAAALTGAIAALDPVGQCWLYNRIKAGYTYSAAQVVTGRKNLVVVITASADSTPSQSRDGLIRAVQSSGNGRVQLDVVGVSENVNALAMVQISLAGDGTFAAVAVADLKATLARLIAG